MTIEITRRTNLRGNLLRILAEGSDYAQTPRRIFDSLYFIEWLGGEQSNLGSIAVKVLKACNRIVWTKSDGEPKYLRLTGRMDMTGTITSTCSCTSPSCTDPITWPAPRSRLCRRDWGQGLPWAGRPARTSPAEGPTHD